MKKYLLYLSICIGLCSFSLFSQEVKTNDPPKPIDAPLPSVNPESEYAFPLEEVLPPKTDQTDRFYKELFNMLGTLGLIIVVVILMAWFLKRVMNTRMQQMNVTSAIKVLESRNLSPKTAIYLVEVHGEKIVIAESHNGATLLTKFSGQIEDSSTTSETSSTFNKILEEKSRPRER